MNRQSKLSDYFGSEFSGDYDEDSESDIYVPDDDVSDQPKKKSRKLPDQWTRVFEITKDQLQEIDIFNLKEDEAVFQELQQAQQQPPNEEWKPLFNPDDFKQQHETLKCKDYELDEQELIEFAEDVSKIRKQILEEAQKVVKLENDAEDQFIDNEIQPPETYRRKVDSQNVPTDVLEDQISTKLKYHATKQQKKLGKQLSLADKTSVAYDAIVGLKSNDEIASKYNVKDTYVSTLVSKIRKNHKYLIEKQEKVEQNQVVEKLIVKMVSGMLKVEDHIWRVSLIQQKLYDIHSVKVSKTKIKYVMRTQLQMRYKKIKKIAFLANAQRCLVMRQIFAKLMIPVLQSGKTIWNFDESFLNETFFTRRKWCQKGETNSIPQKQVSPRISVFLAMNNLGEAYLSLSQSGTDSEKVILFFHHFFLKLDLKQPDWRENTVLLIDGAPYHKSFETLEYLREQNVSLYISAPYSYNTAVCELWFSYFKSKDLNPEKLPTGKSYHGWRETQGDEKVCLDQVLEVSDSVFIRISLVQETLND